MALQWARHLQCRGQERAATRWQGVRRTDWRGCRGDARLVLLTVEGLGHHWPGAEPLPLPEGRVGPYRDTPPATDLFWDFFETVAPPTSAGAETGKQE